MQKLTIIQDDLWQFLLLHHKTRSHQRNWMNTILKYQKMSFCDCNVCIPMSMRCHLKTEEPWKSSFYYSICPNYYGVNHNLENTLKICVILSYCSKRIVLNYKKQIEIVHFWSHSTSYSPCINIHIYSK